MEKNERPGEIDINDLFKKTYNRIAIWHNEMPDMPANEQITSLQTLTHILIQDIGEKIGNKIGIPINLSVAMSPETRKQVDKIKKEEGFVTGNDKLKKMFNSDKESFLD